MRAADLVARISDPALVVRPDGVVWYANPAWQRTGFGDPIERAIGEVIEPEAPSSFELAFREGGEAGSVRIGGIRRGTASVVRDGGDALVLLRMDPAPGVDLGPLVEQAREAFFIKDVRGIYLYVNAAAARMLDRTPAEVIGRNDYEIFRHDTAEEVVAVDRRVMETGLPYTHQPTRFDFSTPRAFLTTKSPYRSRDGAIVGVMGVTVDVTEIVEAHEERSRLEAGLARADRLAMVGTLAYSVAHEINNPLFVVRYELERLEAELADSGAPGRDQLLNRVRRGTSNIDRVVTIVSDLTTFAGSVGAAAGPNDVLAVLEESLQVAGHQLRHRARVIRDFAPVPLVQGQAHRLSQIFVNLLVNAAQALSEQATVENTVTVRTRMVDEDWVEVRVEDSGPGIPADVLPQLFQRFYTTKAPGDGAGLGLWLSRGYVEEQGGTITLGPGPHGGTHAVVRLRSAGLPRVEDAPLPPPVTRQRPSGLEILIIDDEPDLRAVLVEALSGLGRARAFATGREALVALEAQTADVIVCDLMMPELTGMELYDIIGARWPALCARMLFLTGGAYTAPGRRFVEDHAGQVMPKPLRIVALLDAVARLGAQPGASGP